MESINLLKFVVVVSAGIVTFVVSHRVLKEFGQLGSPGLLAFCIAALGTLGILGLGQGWAEVILK